MSEGLTMLNYLTGAELQAYREACGLSRDDLAARVDVQARSIKHWETRSNGVPADVSAFILDLATRIATDTENAILRLSGAPDVVLMRGSDPVKNAITNRVYMALRQAGQDVRIVSFSYPDFVAWLDGGQDTPSMRQTWAKLALIEQAKPHGQDQPNPPT